MVPSSFGARCGGSGVTVILASPSLRAGSPREKNEEKARRKFSSAEKEEGNFHPPSKLEALTMRLLQCLKY